MVELNLYQSGKINKTIPFPTEWNEFSVKELEIISKHFLATFSIPVEAKVAMFIDILKNRAKKIKLSKKFIHLLDGEDVAINGLPLMNFVFTENTLTKQPYHILKLPGIFGKKLTGPIDYFEKLTCGEFEDAEIQYLKFKENPDQNSIANLASILYRPANKKYVEYNFKENKSEIYQADLMVKHFLKLKPHILYNIFIWYSGCRSILPKIFPNVFSSGTSEDDEYNSVDHMAFTKCIHSAAGPKNGTRDNIRRMLLMELFFDMEQEAVKAKELKRQSNE